MDELRNQIEELRSGFLIKSLARQKVGANEAGEESPIETARSTALQNPQIAEKEVSEPIPCWEETNKTRKDRNAPPARARPSPTIPRAPKMTAPSVPDPGHGETAVNLNSATKCEQEFTRTADEACYMGHGVRGKAPQVTCKAWVLVDAVSGELLHGYMQVWQCCICVFMCVSVWCDLHMCKFPAASAILPCSVR